MEGAEKPNLEPQGKLEDELLKFKTIEEELKVKIDNLRAELDKLKLDMLAEIDAEAEKGFGDEDLARLSADIDSKYVPLLEGVDIEIAEALTELGLVKSAIEKLIETKILVEKKILGHESLDEMTPS